MQEFEEILNKIKRKEVSVADLSRATGISAVKIYKWQDRKDPKIEFSDAVALIKWAGLDIRINSGISLADLEPGPEASLEQLVRALREFELAAGRIQKRIDDVLLKGRGSEISGI